MQNKFIFWLVIAAGSVVTYSQIIAPTWRFMQHVERAMTYVPVAWR